MGHAQVLSILEEIIVGLMVKRSHIMMVCCYKLRQRLVAV